MPRRLLHFLLDIWRHTPAIWLGLWIGLSMFTVLLLALMWTRWGQSRPLRKCLALSLLAHLLLAIYATTIHISTVVPKQNSDFWVEMVVALSDDPSPDSEPRQIIFAGETAADLPDSPADDGLATSRPWERAESVAIELPPKTPDRVARPELDAATLAPLPLANLEPVAPATETRLADMLPATQRFPEPDWNSEVLEGQASPATPLSSSHASAASRSNAAATPPDLLGDVARGDVERPRAEAAAAAVAPSVDDAEVSTVSEVPETRFSEIRGSSELVPAAQLHQRLPLPAESLSTPAVLDARLPSAGGELPLIPVPQRAPTLGPLVREVLDRPTAEPPLKDLYPRPAAPRPESAAMGGHNRTDLPPLYRNRQPPERIEAVRRHGGSPETEAAVERALAWLASVQASDGRWDAALHGAGRETMVGGQNRRGAGGKADTGITALAVLAFLGAGYNQQHGKYQRTVENALDFLVRSQVPSGDLAGEADLMARMYCHGMSLLALGEAYGMTRDPRLRRPLTSGVQYTVSSQDRSGGGWRYHPGERGDTSQLGWQIMALKSAEQAGIPVPTQVWSGARRFLASVAHGEHGGLASYRPGERTSRPMTAEALVCRQLLGIAREDAACDEAGEYVLLELPGSGVRNLYYWYYGTLATYQLQGERWERWNKALQGALLASQQTVGAAAGSWDTDDLWGPHGGRIYTTAMATMCLEVYYRYLPLYNTADLASRPHPTH